MKEKNSMRPGLRTKLLVPTLTLILAGLGLSAFFSYRTAHEILDENTRSRMAQLSELTDQRISSFLVERKKDLVALSKERVFATAVQFIPGGNTSKKLSSQILTDYAKSSKYFQFIGIADMGGDVAAASDEKTAENLNISDKKYFKEAVKGEISLSDVFVDESSPQPVLIIAAPIKETYSIGGVIYGVLDLGAFSRDFIDPVKIGELGSSFIVQKNGSLICRADHDLIKKHKLKSFPMIKEVVAQPEGTTRYDFAGRARTAYFRTNKETGWVLVMEADDKETGGPIEQLGIQNAFICAGVALAVSIVILLIVNAGIRSVNRITASLGESAGEIASASGMVALAGRDVAEGASSQAASIEETSASLEQISAMVARNARSSEEADRLVGQAMGIAERTQESMARLNGSMDEITNASKMTESIVKSINGVAFQTNLLALNAAVEAARAGEAGLGFAVVADEVRALAKRAADAAKESESLIERTIRSVRDGSSVLSGVDEDIRALVLGMKESEQLVKEISDASAEQATGIKHVNNGVSHIDSVVQQNAARSHEAAEAADIMNVQAERMNELVHSLAALVYGSGKLPEQMDDDDFYDYPEDESGCAMEPLTLGSAA